MKLLADPDQCEVVKYFHSMLSCVVAGKRKTNTQKFVEKVYPRKICFQKNTFYLYRDYGQVFLFTQ